MNIDMNREAMQTMSNALGSLENRYREVYNKGYRDGLRDGASQVTAKIVSKILEEAEADRKDEPQKWEKPPKFEHKGIQTACMTVPMALIEDEPQTEREGE